MIEKGTKQRLKLLLPSMFGGNEVGSIEAYQERATNQSASGLAAVIFTN